jgi:hypothetical protein
MLTNGLNLQGYPLHELGHAAGDALVERCRSDLARDGMFNLIGFLKPGAIAQAAAEVAPVLATQSFTHKRRHNIYFKKEIAGLGAGHPALREVETVNHTICTDQIAGSIVRELYEWPPMAAFLAAVMGKPQLYVMSDPLAGANVMQYRDGEALNWHFDRAEFTTTLLLQAPGAGGEFEYRSNLRSASDPNYDGVARLLEGQDPDVRILPLAAGTLNVFKGKDTAHRVTPIRGERGRIIAVLSYYDRPGVMFTPEERLAFYGRAQ